MFQMYYVLKAMTFIREENKTLYVAMLFSYFVGLRANEIFSLSWNDVNIGRRSVTYNHKKMGITTKILPEFIISEFISFKSNEEHEDTDPIFTIRNKSRLSNTWADKQLYKIFEKHTLNHFHFSDLYKLYKKILSEGALFRQLEIRPFTSQVLETRYYISNESNQREMNQDDVWLHTSKHKI